MDAKSLTQKSISQNARQRFNAWRAAALHVVVGVQTGTRIAALTFDDGPNPTATGSLLQILSGRNVHATFFLLGRNVDRHPDLARQIAVEGHAIGLHTYHHTRLAGCSAWKVGEELLSTRKAIRRALGRQMMGFRPVLFRPPYGILDATSYLVTRLLGYLPVNWSASGDDWDGRDSAHIASAIHIDLAPGGILLLHDGWEQHYDEAKQLPLTCQDRRPTLEAVEHLIDQLQGQGYRLVTLPELLHMGTPIRRPWFT